MTAMTLEHVRYQMAGIATADDYMLQAWIAAIDRHLAQPAQAVDVETALPMKAPFDRDRLIRDMEAMVFEWDQQAKERHIEGMEASADAYLSCRDDLRRMIRRLKKEAAKS